MPQYSGGLGILAGDHLKSVSALEINLGAVGLFYRHGFFRQYLDGGRQAGSLSVFTVCGFLAFVINWAVYVPSNRAGTDRY